MSQVMRNYACPPTQCTKIHKYWCSPLQLCNDIKTHLSWVLVHKHNKQTATHAHTNSAKLEIKKKFPFPTGSSYRLGSQSHHGLFTDIQSSPRTLAICHT